LTFTIETITEAATGLNQYLLLNDFVSINSQSNNPEGILIAQQFISSILERFNFNIEYIQNPSVSSPPLLVAFKPGLGPETITFIAHSDTVNNPVKHPFKLNLNENKIFGAGVADNKGGVIVCLSALASFLKITPNHHYNLMVVISPSEEIGSPGFHTTFHSLGNKSNIVLGLEPADPDGNIIHSRSGNRWYKVKIKGKSAHSGRFGESYTNAAHEVAGLISEFSSLNNEEKKIRVNVGSISSSTKGFNTICDEIEVKIDTRFPCPKVRDKIHHLFNNLINNPKETCPYTGIKTHIYYSIEDDCPPLAFHHKNEWIVNEFLTSIEYFENKACQSIHSGGAADINYFSTTNNIGIDGLGPVGGHLHTNEEYILADSLASRSNVLLRSLMSIVFSRRAENEYFHAHFLP